MNQDHEIASDRTPSAASPDDTAESTLRTIEQHIDLDAPPDVVFRALTDAAEITRWFAPEARVTPGKGGKVWIAWPGGMEGESEIEVWDPPRRVTLRASIPGAPTPALIAVDYEIQARTGGGSTLRLVHSGFGAGAQFDQEYDETSRGWITFLGNLRHYLARHGGVPCDQLQLPTAVVDLPIEAAYERLLGVLALRNVTSPGKPIAAGDHFEAKLGERSLRGSVDVAIAPFSFGLVVEEWNDAMLRVNFEHCGGPLMAWCVVLTYGLAEPDREAIRNVMKGALEALA